MEVAFQYNYGDYWGTNVCEDIEEVEADQIVMCDRLNMARPRDRHDDEYDEVIGTRVILK